MDFTIQNLHKSFGQKKVLEGINFSTTSGKAFGLLGRNGAGKTTTIRIIMGVFPPDSGSVLVDGKPINRDKLNIGYLPEEHGLYPKKPVYEQLLYLAELRGVRPKQAKESITRWLKRLGMSEYTNKKLDTLSKGNQQKIQLAAALIADPQIVILDEPFSGLDPVNAALLKDVVKELIKTGRIVLFSSHQMSYVEEFCDSIAILHHGDIVLSGNIDDIKRSYDRSIIRVRSEQQSQIEEYCKTQLGGLLESVKSKKGRLYLKLQDVSQKAQLMEKLASQGFDIDGFEVYEPSLNDIFVQYTGDDQEEAKEVQAQ